MKRTIAILFCITAISVANAQQAWQVKQWTPKLIAATTSGSTPDQAHSVTIILSSDFAGTIDGQTITGAAVTAPLVWNGNVEHPLKPIAYTRTAGTLYIIYTKT